MAENRAIGINNDLPWKLPDDLKRFKELTTGHVVIMGRKTFESLPNGALPNRKNVVITSNPDISYKDCEIFNDLSAAINKYENEEEVFIIGGANIYEQAMAFADKLYVTLVHHTFDDADVFFPEIDMQKWSLFNNIDYNSDEKHMYSYTFQTYFKKK